MIGSSCLEKDSSCLEFSSEDEAYHDGDETSFTFDQHFQFSYCLNSDHSISDRDESLESGSSDRRTQLQPSFLNIKLRVFISKHIKHTGTHLWNCSVLLANYFLHEMTRTDHSELFEDDVLLPVMKKPLTILELGCGLGLPSILNCKINERNRSIMTDLNTSDFEERCLTQCKLNSISQNQYRIIPLEWGYDFTSVLKTSMAENIDLIIATDCLYDKKLYDNFFSTIYFLKTLLKKPKLPLLLAQYKRNESDNITFQLKRWNLSARALNWQETIDLQRYLTLMNATDSNDQENLEKQFFELYEATQIVLIK
ncbi:hypothetical protein FDP41_003848 [Naegleria fowleri]|uniref:Methyltransferase-like protein 23 n=1 Tax=Naegleria fowleri TaxID=5763 RepID=A0A6A5BV35_NAEFO|nr:uncharacterized protein FDP41_003848 [Naegleria fowleri]KAF0977195.1 hypothetical protein FDP41_003848 [Naegleria fowleri]CAG4718910.1 unnamed protein product [Naegleria fowleri]